MGLLDIFFEKSEGSDDKQKKKQPIEKVKPEETSSHTPSRRRSMPKPSSTFNISTSSGKGGKFDKEIFEKLSSEIEANNIDGVDYFEFKQSLANMQALAMDDRSRFMAAFAALSASGLSKDVLVNSLKHYLDIIKQEKSQFGDEMTAFNDHKVEGISNEIDNIEATIDQKKKRLEEIKREISQLEKAKKSKVQEKEKIENVIAEKASNFEVTVTHIIEQMEGDLNKINQFIN